MKAAVAAFALSLLAGCSGLVIQTGGPGPGPSAPAATPAPSRGNARAMLASFRQVQAQVEPVAEATCRARNPRANCDFAIGIDRDRRAPPNAFQTVDRNGRPLIIFTQSLIADTQNVHEIAFIMGHEAAHHIRGHLTRANAQASTGAALGAILATVTGGNPGQVDRATQIGGFVGARRFSKNFELEADSLGAIIAQNAGYDALLGAQYFARIPDPGNRFLGTHPPNDQRLATVARTVGR